MTLELEDDEAERLLELHDEFRDDLVQALMDIEEGLHARQLELGDFAALDEAIDGFKDFTGEFKEIAAEKIKEEANERDS